MQSSLAVALRALVMLSCLVALPVWAISGKSLPELTETVLARLDQWRADREVSTFADSSDDDAGLLSEAAPNWTEYTPPGAPGPSEPVHRETPAAPAEQANDGADDLLKVGRHGHDGQHADRTTSPTPDGNSPEQLDPFRENPSDSAREAATGPPPSAEADAELAAVQHRLRSLGATQYTLEKWGQGSPLFRFQCDVAIADNPDHCRHFEATQRTPEHAMTAVLQQVESWRGEIRR
ncbi:MAG: hypothetical protein WDZ59_15025 [Pirellulales bacterium]